MSLLQVGVIVEGAFGPLIPATNPDGTIGRSRRQRLQGVILASVDERRWRVQFNDGKIKECRSTQLKFVSDPRYNNPVPSAPAPVVAAPQPELVQAAPPPTVTNPLVSQVQHPTAAVYVQQPSTTTVENETTVDDAAALIQREHHATEEDSMQMERDQVDAEEDVVEGMVDEDEGVDNQFDFDIVEDVEEDVHVQRRQSAEQEKELLLREQWSVTKHRVTWNIVRESTPASQGLREYESVSVRNVNFELFSEKRTILKEYAEEASKKRKTQNDNNIDDLPPPDINITPFLDLFLALWPGDWRNQLTTLNKHIQNSNTTKQKNSVSFRKVKLVSASEFFTFLGLMVVSAASGCTSSSRLFETEHKRYNCGVLKATDPTNYMKYMSFRRFQELAPVFNYAFSDTTRADRTSDNFDPYHPIIQLFEDFNKNRKDNVAGSFMKVLDESMSAFKPRTSRTGGLPNISFILRKPEPLGTEFKCVTCAVTGIMLHLEVQRGKDSMPLYSSYFRELGACTSCTVRLAEATTHCGQHDETTTVPNLFFGDSWFASVKTAEEINNRGGEWVGPVKTAHSCFPKEALEEKMKDWPSGTHLVLEALSPVHNKPLLAIGYKYNSRKVLCFVATKNAGSTRPGFPYKARFKDENNNTVSRPVDRPDIISHYFKYSNCVDKHNQVRQFELALEKKWVTQNPWFRLFTTVLGIVVTDCWKAYLHYFPTSSDRACKNVIDFADCMAYELLNNKCSKSDYGGAVDLSASRKRKTLSPIRRTGETNQDDDHNQQHTNQVIVCNNNSTGRSPISPLRTLELTTRTMTPRSVWRYIRSLHPLEKIDNKDKSGNTKRKICRICRRQTVLQCAKCKKPFCNDQQGAREDYCYSKHIVKCHPDIGLTQLW